MEVAEEIGISQAQVSRLEKTALNPVAENKEDYFTRRADKHRQSRMVLSAPCFIVNRKESIIKPM